MKKVAFIFPGQGSQYIGMGKELYENFQIAKEIFDEADDTLHFSISKICFEGPDETLKLTENTQPAILTVSIAALKVIEAEKGITAELTAGHSLGEYSALVASGALSFKDAVDIVRLRGKFMQEAVPVGEGTMAAVLGMDAKEVEKLCEEVSQGEVLTAANFNCPGQVVISGHIKAVERAIERVKKGGKKGVLLPVSSPFHSPLMRSAAEKLKDELEEIPINELKIPIVTNVEAEINRSKERVKPLLVEQITSSVKWEESMRRMVAEGIEKMIEIGPGKVLTGLMKRIDPNIEVANVEDIKTLKMLS